MATRPQIIALEEHYADAELQATFQGFDANRGPAMVERLLDVAALRLREMDEAGIDLQVLSHTAPSADSLSQSRSRKVMPVVFSLTSRWKNVMPWQTWQLKFRSRTQS